MCQSKFIKLRRMRREISTKRVGPEERARALGMTHRASGVFAPCTKLNQCKSMTRPPARVSFILCKCVRDSCASAHILRPHAHTHTR